VTKKISEATRVFHQIKRLSNTERGLSFQAMRQLYIACISSIADYGVPIWWNGQKHFLDKFQKLQNLALQKILGAFKKSPTQAMEIEASLPPPAIRFNRMCRNYALRTSYFTLNHPIRVRLPHTFPISPGLFQVDRSTYLDWNEKEESPTSALDNSDSNFSDLEPSTQNRGRSRRKRQYPSQLIRIISLVSSIWQGPSQNGTSRMTRATQDQDATNRQTRAQTRAQTRSQAGAETRIETRAQTSQHHHSIAREQANRSPGRALRPWFQSPWAPRLHNLVDLTISEKSKEEAAIDHNRLVSEWARDPIRLDDNIVIYSDGSQSERGFNGSGLFITNNLFTNQNVLAWHLGKECEVYDSELYAIKMALEVSYSRLDLHTSDLWVFSDSQASLLALKNQPNQVNNQIYKKIYYWTQKLVEKSIKIHLYWVPGHMGVYGNEMADQAAKYGAEWDEDLTKTTPSLSMSFLKRKAKETAMGEWQSIWQGTRKSTQYQDLKTQPRWKATPLKLNKLIWSTITQLKLGHGYFRSYLVRLPDYSSANCNICQTNQPQTPYHLIFQCPEYSEIRKKTIYRLDPQERTLYSLFSSELGLKILIDFLRETKIATRTWHLGLD
jgi:ribonuclease HI